jgi:hypothetical protein
VLRAALDRAVPLTSTSPHRCRIPPGSDRDDNDGGGGDPVFTPIDQHGYPALDRALAPTSLARLAARHLDGRPPARQIIAPTPRPAGPATPPATPPPPPPPSAATLQAAHRHVLGRRRDDLRQLDALDRLLDALERQADRANQQITALASPAPLPLDRPQPGAAQAPTGAQGSPTHPPELETVTHAAPS